MTAEKPENFAHICGEIIRQALSVEHNLDLFIVNYFFWPPDPKGYFFEELMLRGDSGFGFGRKIQVFDAICKEADIDHSKRKEARISLKFVSEIRNAAAHHSAYVDNPRDPKVKLKKSYREPQGLEVNKDLLDKVRAESLKAIKILAELAEIVTKQSTAETVPF